MFFKGGSFHSPSTKPASLADLSGTPIAPLQPLAQDIILFQGMSIHGGSPKTDGYKEEHAAGLIGCGTGDAYHYSKNDSYYAYTDNESIDITIANHYQTIPALKALPFASLHVGGGAHSDADNVGSASATSRTASASRRRAVRQRDRADPDAGRSTTADAAGEPALLGASSTPATDTTKLRAAAQEEPDRFQPGDIADAKRVLGMDSAHAQKLDGLVDGWREVERPHAELAPGRGARCGGAAPVRRRAPTATAPRSEPRPARPCTIR
jgi:hypothetical protein